MTDLTLREYSRNDASELMRMWRETAHLWPMGAPHPTEISEEAFNSHIEGSGAVKHWVVVDDSAERVVGYCAFSQDSVVPEHMEVSLLNTHPDWQGKGIGKMMLIKCIETTAALKRPALFLGTWPGNERACGLYKRLGFFHKPKTDIGFVNFIPSVLQCGLVSSYLDSSNWLKTLKRDTSYGPDEFKDGEMKVFPYRFETVKGVLEIGFERYSNGLYRVVTPDLELKLTADYYKGWKAFPRTLTLQRTTQQSVHEDWSVELQGDHGLSVNETLAIAAATPSYTNALTVTVPADLSLAEVQSPAVNALVKAGDMELARLSCGFKPVEPVEVIFLGRRAFVPADTETIRHVNVINNMNRPVETRLNLTSPQGVVVTPASDSIALAAGETRSIPLTVCGEPGDYTVLCQGCVDGTDTELPEQKIHLGIVSPDRVVCIETSKSILVQNGFYLFTIGKLEGNVVVRPLSDRHCSIGLLPIAAGPPYPNYGSDGKPVYAISRSDTQVTICMEAMSRQFKGVKAVQEFILNPSAVVSLDAWVEFNGHKYPNLNVRQRVTEPGYLRQTVFPVGDLGHALDQQACHSIENHFNHSTLMSTEYWMVSRGVNCISGCFWKDRPCDPEFSAYYAVTTTAPISATPSEKSVKMPRTYFYAGPGNVETLRNLWRQFCDEKAEPLQWIEPVHCVNSPVTLSTKDSKLPISLKTPLKSVKNLTVHFHADDFLGVTPQSIPAGDLLHGETKQISIPLNPADQEPGIRELAGEFSAAQWESTFSVPVIRTANGKVAHTKSRKGRFTVHNLTSDSVQMTVAPGFPGHVTSLMWDGREYLASIFPNTGVMGFEKPYYGGISPQIESYEDQYSQQKFKGKGQFVDFDSYLGIRWQGVRVTCKVNDDNPLKGSRLICHYLMSPDLPVVRIVAELANKSNRFVQNTLMAIQTFHNPEDFMSLAASYSENGRRRLYRRGTVGASLPFDKHLTMDYCHERPALHLAVRTGGKHTNDVIDTGQGDLYAYLSDTSELNPGDIQHLEYLIGIGDIGKQLVTLL